MGFFSRIFSRQAEAEPAAPIVKLPGDRILRYKITGKNPGTRRRNTRRVLCGSWEAISDVEARTGYSLRLLMNWKCQKLRRLSLSL